MRKSLILGGIVLAALGASVACGGDDTAEVPVDDSPTLLGDGPIRTLCGEHCYADCQRLVECGRYTSGGYSACVAECTGVDGRDCGAQTFDGLCPIADYGPDRVITEFEYDLCVDDARNAACWCDPTQNCFDPADFSLPLPFSCIPASLCDPRW